jgi:hypothetical protein
MSGRLTQKVYDTLMQGLACAQQEGTAPLADLSAAREWLTNEMAHGGKK